MHEFQRTLIGWCQALLLTTLIALPTFASSQQVDLETEIKALGTCRDCEINDTDLSKQRLLGMDFRDSTLRNVDFSNGYLMIAMFQGKIR